MKNWLEKQFRLSEFHTDVKTEILAGLTTFVTMAYILATVPNISLQLFFPHDVLKIF